MKDWAGASTIVLILVALLAATVVSQQQDTSDQSAGIALPGNIFRPCQAIPIITDIGPTDNDTPCSIPLCIVKPDGIFQSIDATGNRSVYKAIFWPQKGETGTYRVTTPGNENNTGAQFTVDDITISGDISVEIANSSLLTANYSLKNACGEGDETYTVVCRLDGVEVYREDGCSGIFNWSLPLDVNNTHYLSTRATDAQGISRVRIDIVGGSGSIATLSDHGAMIDTSGSRAWRTYDLALAGTATIPLEAFDVPAGDQVCKAWQSGGTDLQELPIVNGTIEIMDMGREDDLLCLEINPADSSIEYLSDTYGVPLEADGAWPADVPRLVPAGAAETEEPPVAEPGSGETPYVPVDAFGVLNVTNQPWPADSQWTAWINAAWDPVRAPTYDVSPKVVDITSGGAAKPLVGPNNSVYLYYNNTSKFLFFRLLLSEPPYSGGGYENGMWGMELDSDGDGWANWGSFVNNIGGGTTNIMVGYVTRGHATNNIDFFIYTQSANPALGFARTVTDNRGQDGNQMYYLDWQMPLAAFSVSSPLAPDNVTENSTVRLFFGTSYSSNLFNKDILGQTSTNFSLGPNMTLGGIGNGEFGTLYDTRDPSPPSNLGIWYYNQTLTVNGSGWPASNPALTNLTVRVINATGTVFNTATVSYNTSTGVVTNAPIWNIPANGTPAPGIYGIWVKNPGGSTTYKWYDNFTLADNIPPVVTNVTVTPDLTAPNASIRITANVTDNYQIANVTASFASTTLNMTYNATSRLYEVNATAPAAGGVYTITVRAWDVYSNTGSNTTLLTVSASYPSVAKAVRWSRPAGAFNISLNVTNLGSPANVIVFDFVPASFTANVSGTLYAGPTSINFTRFLARGQSVFINYTVSSGASAYNASQLWSFGLDPAAEDS